MPVHTTYVQRVTGGHGCDLCDWCDPRNTYWTYVGRSPIEQREPNHRVRIRRWTESEYRLCLLCKTYVETNNPMALDYRISRLNPRLKPKVIEERLRTFFSDKRRGIPVVGAHAR